MKYIRDKVLPTIQDFQSPIRSHFEAFLGAVQSLAGFPLTLDDINFDNLNSKVINSAISYSRGGIELQLLPECECFHSTEHSLDQDVGIDYSHG